MPADAPAPREATLGGEIALGHLTQNLSYLSRVIRTYLRAENALLFFDYEIEQGEIAIINLLGLNPGISQNDLAANLVIKKSAVTKLIKQLEARGLVVRRKVKADKRFNALSLTREGQAKYDRLTAAAARQHEDLLACFSPRERADLFEYLNRLQAHLAQRSARRIGACAAQVEDED
jgi:DNA-binding MarR family transcriptional regulator